MFWIVLLLFLPFFSFAQAEDSLYIEKNTENQDTLEHSEVEIITFNSTLKSIISFPFTYIITPITKFLIYPAIPPLIYMADEDIINKGLNIVTFGKKRNIMLYPTFNIQIGSGSSTGLTYRHENILFDYDYFLWSLNTYVDGDWDNILRYTKKLQNNLFYYSLKLRYREYGDNFFNVLGDKIYTYADTSVNVEAMIGTKFTKNFGAEFAFQKDWLHFDKPNIKDDIMEDSLAAALGFYKYFEQYPLTFSLIYDSRDFQYAPTRGNKIQLSYTYVPVLQLDGEGNRDYSAIEAKFVNYTLFGNKSYFFTTKETKESRQKLMRMSFKDAVELLNPTKIREEILERRIIVTQIRFRYLIEHNPDNAPFTAFGKINPHFPLRAYKDGDTPFAKTVAGLSTEYRFPVDRLADGVFFNEYAIFGNELNSDMLKNIRNSWGVGFRVRKENLFIFRFSLAFHGLQGINLLLTIKPEYE